MTRNERIKLEDIKQRLLALSNTNPSYYMVMAGIDRELVELIERGKADGETEKSI